MLGMYDKKPKWNSKKMTRSRLYPNNASRQKAYRDRRLVQFRERGEIIRELQQEIRHLEDEILNCPNTHFHILDGYIRKKDESSS